MQAMQAMQEQRKLGYIAAPKPLHMLCVHDGFALAVK